MPGPGSVPRHVPRRKRHISRQRKTSRTASSTYGNNKLRSTSPGRPGASLGGRGGTRTNPNIRRQTSTTTHPRAKIGNTRYRNYRITGRNPMED